MIPDDEPIPSFEGELRGLINKWSEENASNTPDFILANYLLDCLSAWNRAVQQRETFYVGDPRPTLAEGTDEAH
jgi:hypothetical protein